MQLPAGAVSSTERWTRLSRFKVRTAVQNLSPPAWHLLFAPGTHFWVGQPWTVSWHQAARRSILQGWASLCWAVGLQGATGPLPSGLWEMGVLLLRGHGLWGWISFFHRCPCGRAVAGSSPPPCPHTILSITRRICELHRPGRQPPATRASLNWN